MCVKAYSKIHVCVYIYIYNELDKYKVTKFLLVGIEIKF